MTEVTKRRRAKAVPWKLTKVGSYGVFSTAGSLPVEYLQTTFNQDELAKLTLARDVRPDEMDFEMLMQRDINEERAETSLKAYLNPRGSNPADVERHPVFFPPLLVACVPTESKKVLDRYPNEKWDDTNPGRLIRRWEDMFQLEFYTEDWVDKYELKSPDSDQSAFVDLVNVEAKFNLSTATEAGIKLIAIDGQHRLHALQKLVGHPSDVISRLVVPVCVLFSTSASAKAQEYRQNGGSSEVPDVPGTFRKIFVDVNSKMEVVGAHTNILLNDTNIGSLIVREFCSMVNRELRSRGLASVEWNLRSIKDSTILKRDYSITSIGVLDLALRDNFLKEISLLRRLLDIDDATVSEKLRDAADDADSPDIEWTKFSISQRRQLVPRVREGIVSLLYRIFFELAPYAAAYQHYRDTLGDWENKAAENRDDSSDHERALNDVLSFREPKEKTAPAAITRKMGREQKEWRRNNLSPVIGYALFQRSIILTLRELMLVLPSFRITEVGDALITLLERALAKEIGLFQTDRAYTVKTVWHESGSIVNREQTRRQLSRLTLALLGGSDLAEIVAERVASDDERITVIERLKNLGEERAGDYWKRYVMDRENHFGKTYMTNLALDTEAVDQLKEADRLQKDETEQIKAGTLDEEDATRPFDRAVHEHLVDEFRQAEGELRNVLGFEKHIVSAASIGHELDEDE